MGRLKETREQYKNHREPCSVCGRPVVPFGEGTHISMDVESCKTRFQHWDCRPDKARKYDTLVNDLEASDD
jgi:hypothetical protein